MKLRRVKGFRRAEIATLAQRNFHPASTVVSDGLHCFTGVGNAGCVHQPIITGSGRKAALNPAFKWVNTTLGNIKSAITGTYRAIGDKHVPRYLAEFEYRFNRRYDLAAMMPRLGYVAVRTPPMPYRLLKLAEACVIRKLFGRPTRSFWRRLAGRFAGENGVEERARLFRCILCRRLVVFKPMTGFGALPPPVARLKPSWSARSLG